MKIYDGMLDEKRPQSGFLANVPWLIVIHVRVPLSQLHAKPSYKCNVKRFSQNGVGRGHLVAVTVST